MYFVEETIELGVRDSYITISAYNSEEVVFSGGVDLSSLSWSVYEGNVLVAPLPDGVRISVDALNELYVNGRRAVRARYPERKSGDTGTVDSEQHRLRRQCLLVALRLSSRRALSTSRSRLLNVIR